MDFTTVQQASEKQGIRARRIQTSCMEGRIEGVERLGHRWIVPVNTEKPKDARIESGKYTREKFRNRESEDGKKAV